MKTLKFILLSLVITMFTLTSCDNTDPIINVQNPNQSASAKTAMSELQQHFTSDGALRDGNNPTGNILFDYCFNFQLPVTLSYNNGATVVINDFNDLVRVLIGMNDQLYINGIVFPFNVEVYDEATDAVVVQTIHNENEFETLINSCNFDGEDCVCTDDYAPVCVEISVNGQESIVQYPNACEAACDGFTQNDFVNCDSNSDPTGGDGDDCFEFIYPISITSYAGDTYVIESDTEWENVMYTINGFDFVYPFQVRVLDTQNLETIATMQDYLNVLNSCNGNNNSCEVSNLSVQVGNCNTDGTYSITIDFTATNPGNEYFDLYVRNNQSIGYYAIADLPITISDFSLSGLTSDYLRVAINDNNDCYAEIEWVAPNCNNANTCWDFVFPIEINTTNGTITANNNTEVSNAFGTPANNAALVYPFDVTINGATRTISTPNNFWEIGEWANQCN